MKKAIVTGATGAVGTALVNKLISKGVETLVLVRKGGRVNKIPSNPLVKIAYCSLDEMADFQKTCTLYASYFSEYSLVLRKTLLHSILQYIPAVKYLYTPPTNVA